jgi:hypothetical protein
VLGPPEGASEEKSNDSPVLPSNAPLHGKVLQFQQYLEAKKQQEEQKKKKREKTKKRRIEKEEIKEKLRATTSYCKEQDWTFAS